MTFKDEYFKDLLLLKGGMILSEMMHDKTNKSSGRSSVLNIDFTISSLKNYLVMAILVIAHYCTSKATPSRWHTLLVLNLQVGDCLELLSYQISSFKIDLVMAILVIFFTSLHFLRR